MNKDYFDEISDRQLGLDKLNAKLGGVCAGVAHHLEVPRAFVRGAAIIALLIAPQATLLAYGLGYLILEDQPSTIFEDHSASEDINAL
ncbi:MAG TPA: hypothetical protein DCM54_10245 [Gammaproteobacteria bacterium]|nr:hypothetical protein [Gammaproteobacteria bacterium]|tara:strand:+ start:3013 stop:3276 length:264 start_codon:yes stop_codon:yes gene_type:complete